MKYGDRQHQYDIHLKQLHRRHHKNIQKIVANKEKGAKQINKRKFLLQCKNEQLIFLEMNLDHIKFSDRSIMLILIKL